MNRLLKFFSANYKPLLVSFFLALLLWIAVTTDKTYTMRLDVPFSISRLAEGYVLAENLPDKVTLEVSGKGRALFGLNFYQPSINLELPDVTKSGTIQLKDYQQRFHIPRNLGVKIVDIIRPRAISLKVDRLLTTQRKIHLRAQIKPAPGYVLNAVQLNKDSVRISGPAKLVRSLKSVKSDTVFKKDKKYPFTLNVGLINPKPGIVRLEPESVLARFILEQLVERTFYNIPIQLLSVPGDYEGSAVPPTVTVRVKGSASRISNLRQNQLTALFDFRTRYKSGVMLYSPQIDAPYGVEIMDISPKQFRLQLKRNEESD